MSTQHSNPSILNTSSILSKQVKQRISEHGCNNMITQLCLDQINIDGFNSFINNLIQKCSSVCYLSLQYCHLVSVRNMPRLLKLTYLDLANNHLDDDSLLQLLQSYSQLEGLNISKNNITNINKLTPILQQHENLFQILFQNCNTLQCLNHQDKKNSSDNDCQHYCQNNQNQLSSNSQSNSQPNSHSSSNSNQMKNQNYSHSNQSQRLIEKQQNHSNSKNQQNHQDHQPKKKVKFQ